MKTKKIMYISLALCLLTAALFPLLFGKAVFCNAPLSSKEGILRLHVIANSDSDLDQQTKLKVRDALLPLFESKSSYGEAREFVIENGGAIEEICENTLQEAGCDYGVQLLLGKTSFPDKTYGDVTFPAGDYDALCVVLGEGGGKNWWCVLFPPLCILTEDGKEVNYEDLEFDSDIAAWFREHWKEWF